MISSGFWSRVIITMTKALTKTDYDLETLGDIITSNFLKYKCQELGMKKKMTHGLDVFAILAQLLQKGLLTDNEWNELMKPNTRQKRFLKLEHILANKGPLAYLHFTEALIDTKEDNPLHEELLMCLLGSSDSADSNLT